MSKSRHKPPAPPPAGVELLQKRMGHVFRDPTLLVAALTHRSYSCETPAALHDNQRLEFLGDAVLDLLAAERLFRTCPDWQEGRLTKVRSRLANADTLATVAARIGLGSFLFLGRGEEASGGRSKPAVLADALEALIGALWLDAGPETARDFFGREFDPEFREALAAATDVNPKGQLQEIAQARWKQTPVYELLSTEGPAHAPVFSVAVRIGPRIVATASGPSLRLAESAAAAAAISRLEKEAP